MVTVEIIICVLLVAGVLLLLRALSDISGSVEDGLRRIKAMEKKQRELEEFLCGESGYDGNISEGSSLVEFLDYLSREIMSGRVSGEDNSQQMSLEKKNESETQSSSVRDDDEIHISYESEDFVIEEEE